MIEERAAAHQVSRTIAGRRTLVSTVSIVAVVAMAVSVVLTAAADDAAPYVVVISLDGLKPESYTQPGGADTPTLRRLASRGAFASGVVGEFPTLTFPSHTTLITGVPPAVHGIYNNRLFDPENRTFGAWYWYARDVRVPTLLDAVHARGLIAAAVSWPVTVGLDIDFLVPEFSPRTLDLLRGLSTPAHLLDDIEAARGAPLPWPITDAARTEIAAWIFRVHKPHLLMLHLVDTDTAQHESEPNSPQALAAIAAADRHVATVVDAVNASGLATRTNIVIVSDHGFLQAGRRLELNTLFRREGWLRVDDEGRVIAWDVYLQPAGGSGFVFLSRPDDAGLRDRVRTLLDTVASDPANGIERVLSAEDLRALGADPRASFAIDMKSGYYAGAGAGVGPLSGTPTGGIVVQSASRGGHGYDPSRPEMYASLIMAGPQVPNAGDLGIVRMTAIAPTIAAWLNVTLSPQAGEPLSGVMAPHHQLPGAQP
jgi:predicted AlkP superfamily pyrophosphatase or phosphodiesterase